MKETISTWPIGALILMFFGSMLLLNQCSAYDSTDDVANKKRSGMYLYTDHYTGCQYLGTASFLGRTALTPRLDADGKQVCK